MEQSGPVLQPLTFRSPLPVAEVRSRINAKCLNRLFGFVLYLQGNPAELFGKVRDRRVRLQAPSLFNNSEPTLVGTLEDAPDEGTILRAQFQMSHRAWSRGAPYNAQQIDRITKAIARISGLVLVDGETT
jgi:hypothetical protein